MSPAPPSRRGSRGLGGRESQPDGRGEECDLLGGGVTGLSAALLLSRRGVRTALIERHPSTALLPQARAFNPRSMEIYRAAGLEPDIRTHTSMLADHPEMIGTDTLGGRERFRVDLLAQVRPPAGLSPTDWCMIDEDELERLLRPAAEQAGADIRFGVERVSLDARDDGVTVLARTVADGTEQRLHADYLIAADGHRAGIRHELGIGQDGPGVLFDGLYFIVEADLTAHLRGRRFLLAYLDRPRPGSTLVPLPGHRWLVGVPYPPGSGERPEQLDAPLALAMFREAVGDPSVSATLVPPVPGWPQLISTSTVGGWVAQRYRNGRVFMAGDAAHVVPPSGSYGANTGIADAHNLAWKLAARIAGHAGDGLLDTYEAERRPVAQATLQAAMDLLQGRHTGTTGDITAIDDILMIFGYRYASAAVRTESDTDPATVGDPRTASGAPGQRAPHVVLVEQGREISTLDLFDATFTLLVGPGGDWAGAAKAATSATGAEVTVRQIGVDLHDPTGGITAAYGISGYGAALVRPDGFVAWRARTAPDDPERTLTEVLGQLLGPAPSRTKFW